MVTPPPGEVSDGVTIEVDSFGNRCATGNARDFVTTPVFIAGDGDLGRLMRSTYLGLAAQVSETQVIVDVYDANPAALSQWID